MKIISTYKDYYDYLSGIWGVDPLIVLDRRRFSIPFFLKSETGKLEFYIAGYKVDGLYKEGHIYFGEELNQFDCDLKTKERKFKYWNLSGKEDYLNSKLEDIVIVITNSERFYMNHIDNHILSKKVIPDIHNLNEKYNCPIFLANKANYGEHSFEFDNYPYPILRDLNIPSILPPEDIYKKLSDWISLQKTKSESTVDNRTNNQKIEGKGFDTKTSFRNIK